MLLLSGYTIITNFTPFDGALLVRELFPNYYRMYMLSVIYFCTLLTLMYGSSESVFSFAEDNRTSF